MKIAIITYSWSQNWGALLQAYATQEYLKKQGHEVKLIDYREFDNKRICTVKSIMDGIVNIFYMKQNSTRITRINKFRNDYLNLTEKCNDTENLKRLNSKFDAFITGSDQVWNCGLGVCKDFYLEFVDSNKKKISYAASFGISKIPKEHIKDTINGLNNIEFLSVRENDGQDIIKSLTDREAELVLDPVFLLEKNFWGNVASERIEKEKYIFVYPTQITKSLKNMVKELKAKTGYKVISPFYIKGCTTKKDIGPIEFINYIKNSEFIIASSFHAIAFSLIFEKQFCAIPHTSTGSRIINLLENLSVSQCIVNEDAKYDLDTKIDYNITNKNKKIYIEKSKRFLNRACENKSVT